MEKPTLFLLLFTCHIIGDYFLQSESLSEEKKQKFKAVICHSVCYSIPYLLCGAITLYIYKTNQLWWLLIKSIFFHFVIDSIKYIVEKFFGQTDKNSILYSIDQFVHLLCLALLVKEFSGQIPFVSQYVIKAIHHIAYFLCLLKPANVTYKILFSQFQPSKEENLDETQKIGAGALIGNLERLLSGILILLGEFAAVGLAMTAKSIARYDQISTRPDFAEYYLIGTLYSILYTIVMYWAVFKFIL